MAYTYIGFDGTVTEAEFSRLMRTAALSGGHDEYVQSGFDVSATGTRQVAVTAGTAWAAGVRVVSDSTVTLTMDTTPAPRVDYVVLEVNWSTNAAVVKLVKGTSLTWPALTKTEGSLWQVPLARATATVAGFTTASISGCKPARRIPRVYRSTDLLGETELLTTSRTAGNVTAFDPGWAYNVSLDAALRFGGGSGGAVLSVVDSAGTVLATSYTANVSTSSQPGHLSVMAGPYTGTQRFTLRLEAIGIGTTGAPRLLSSPMNRFTVTSFPA